MEAGEELPQVKGQPELHTEFKAGLKRRETLYQKIKGQQNTSLKKRT